MDATHTILNNGTPTDILFTREQKYWHLGADGQYHHPPNRMPADVAWWSLSAAEGPAGRVIVDYAYRKAGECRPVRIKWIVLTETWAEVVSRAGGYGIGEIVRYLADELEDIEQFCEGYNDEYFGDGMYYWRYADLKRMMSADPHATAKIETARRSYVRSLSTFDRYAEKYPISKDALTFNDGDDVLMWGLYHALLIVHRIPTWQVAEMAVQRWYRCAHRRSMKPFSPRGSISGSAWMRNSLQGGKRSAPRSSRTREDWISSSLRLVWDPTRSGLWSVSVWTG